MIEYRVIQLVKNVKNNRLECVVQISSERIARHEYEVLSKENPEEYFELRKITHIEDCLAFTGQKVVQ